MRQIILLTALLLAGLSGSSAGQTAAQMQSYCKPIVEGRRTAGTTSEDVIVFPHTFETGLCWGAFASVQTAFIYAQKTPQGMVSTLGACIPAEGTRTDLIRIFSDYLDKHLALLSEDFFKVVFAALHETYPRLCR